jgi:Putative sugar-binding domain
MINHEGEIIHNDLDNRLIAITGDQLKNIPHVVAVAGDASKHKAIAATLRSGVLETLVTDAKRSYCSPMGGRHDGVDVDVACGILLGRVVSFDTCDGVGPRSSCL